MKVRFSSQKEHEPMVDGGLKVLYAPGKRTAFRLRWYLILLVVTSPLIWLGYTVLDSAYAIEAPARVHVGTVDIRALQPGIVRAIHRGPGDSVRVDSPLVALSNSTLEQRYFQLQSGEGSALDPLDGLTARRDLQLAMIGRAEDRVLSLQRLFDQKAATAAELQRAIDERDARRADLLVHDEAQRRTFRLPLSERRNVQRNMSELTMVSEQLQQLNVSSPTAGKVIEVAVVTGENVGPGTLLMRVQRDMPAAIQVYISPKHSQLAEPGRSLQLQLPDKTWLDARVTGKTREVGRLPPSLRSPLSSGEQMIIVDVQTAEPLPQHWQMADLQLLARFKRFGG